MRVCFIILLKKLCSYTRTVIRAILWKVSYMHMLLSVDNNHIIIHNYKQLPFFFAVQSSPMTSH